MVSMARPSSFPGFLRGHEPWPSPRRARERLSRWIFDLSGSVRASSISTSARAANVHRGLDPLMT
jgi:hypothetical protein